MSTPPDPGDYDYPNPMNQMPRLDAERTWEIAKGMMRLLSGYVDIRDRLFALPEFLAFCHERERTARLAAFEDAAMACDDIGVAWRDKAASCKNYNEARAQCDRLAVLADSCARNIRALAKEGRS